MDMTRTVATKKIVTVALILFISTFIVSAQPLGYFNFSNIDSIFIQDHRMARSISGGDTSAYNFNQFTFNDSCAYSWIQFKGTRCNPHVMTWKWYSPNGKLYLTNHLNLSTHCVRGEWSVWSCLPIKGYMPLSLAGEWRVDVFLDNSFAFTEYFRIGHYIKEPKPMTVRQPPIISLGASLSN
jgi:hypothetical protein